MKPLEDMTYTQRCLLTIIIVLVILFALAFIGWATGRWGDGPMAGAASKQTTEPVPPTLQPNPLDGEILTLDRVALDSAYRAQMALLFATWLKDPSYGPERAKVGARWARQAYVDLRTAFDKREAEFNARFGVVEKQCK